MTIHPALVTLERLAVGDLPDQASADISKHVDACPQCQHFLAELTEAASSCLRSVPPQRVLNAVSDARRRHARVVRWTQLSVVSAVAALAIFLVSPWPTASVRFKGVGLAVQRKRGNEVRVMESSSGIRAGDALRMVVTLPKPTSVAVWSIDAHGRVDRLAPAGGISLDAGEHALPESAVVESPCVDLWLVLMTGTRAEQQLTDATRKAAEKQVEPGEGWAPPGALIKSFRCEN
jgi:anti-sigma factor RsiW